MFPDGWPGTGLLFLRLVAGIVLIHHGLIGLVGTHPPEAVARELIAAGAGMFLLAGLWTPITGVLVAIVELWIGLLATQRSVDSPPAGSPGRRLGDARNWRLVYRCSPWQEAY
jgi:hypothetical protein